MSFATYARALVTARTRSVAAASRGRACVRRDAVCGQDAADIFGAFARLLSVGTSGFAMFGSVDLGTDEYFDHCVWLRVAATAFFYSSAVEGAVALLTVHEDS